jgi:molybdopterin synthase catalytic subunit
MLASLARRVSVVRRVGVRGASLEHNLTELTTNPLDTATILARVNTPAAGAVVLFLGTVREHTSGRRTVALDYECYPEMARKKLDELEAEARRRWPLVECVLAHRLGRLELGEASVAVAVSTPHRRDAFEAGQWLIDTLKQVVPIWKQENWADGAKEWVHPGPETAAPARQEGAA